MVIVRFFLCGKNCRVGIGGVMEMGRGVIEGEVLVFEREVVVNIYRSSIGNVWVNGLCFY